MRISVPRLLIALIPFLIKSFRIVHQSVREPRMNPRTPNTMPIMSPVDKLPPLLFSLGFGRAEVPELLDCDGPGERGGRSSEEVTVVFVGPGGVDIVPEESCISMGRDRHHQVRCACLSLQ